MHPGGRLPFLRTVAAGAGSLALVTLGGYGSEGCRTPTQVTVELRTMGALPCASLLGVAIVVARTPQDAEEKMRLGVLSAEVPRGVCEADGRTLGTLVVTPQDSTGAIVVAARYSSDPNASCEPPEYKGCIVARRSFSFIEHASVTLPISLEVACVDVPCDVVSSCRAGTCVSSETQCSESSGRCESGAEPSPDGGVGAADGAVADGATPDADRTDSSLDAPGDAPPDADPAGFGNDCPTSGGPLDCTAQAQVCCYMGSYFCNASCPMGYFVFNCIGRKHCNGAFCCGNAGAPQGSFCDTTAGQACAQNGSHYLCTGDGDCPPSLPRCNGIYYDVGSGTTRECTIN